jgi:hypothetical protein
VRERTTFEYKTIGVSDVFGMLEMFEKYHKTEKID